MKDYFLFATIFILSTITLYAQPYDITTSIHSDEIAHSGAQNLYELLEQNIPGFTYLLDNQQGYRSGINGIITQDHLPIEINGTPIYSSYHNSSRWLLKNLSLSYIDSIVINKTTRNKSLNGSLFYPKINIYLKSETSASAEAISGLHKKDNLRLHLNSSYHTGLRPGNLSTHLSFTTDKGAKETRIFGSDNSNWYGPDELLSIGDTGAALRGIAPQKTDGDLLSFLSFTSKNWSLLTLFDRSQISYGGYNLFSQEYEQEHWNHLTNSVSFQKKFSSGTHYSSHFFHTYINQQNIDTDPTRYDTLSALDEHQLELNTKLIVHNSKRIFQETEIGYQIHRYNFQRSSSNIDKTLSNLFLKSTTKFNFGIFHPSIFLQMQLEPDGGKSISPGGALHFTPHPKHTLHAYIQNKTVMRKGLFQDTHPVNNNSYYPHKWTFENGHLLGKDELDSGATNIYILGDLIPPTYTSNSLNERHLQAALLSSHTLTSNLSLHTESAIQKITGETFYDNTYLRYRTGGNFNTLSFSLEGIYQKEEILRINTSLHYTHMLSLSQVALEEYRPPIGAEWDEISQSWLPIMDTSTLLNPAKTSLANSLYATDSMHLNNLPTVTTKFRICLSPKPWFTTNIEGKLFGGLKGRKAIHKSIEEKHPQSTHLNLHKLPIAKLDCSIQFYVPHSIRIGLGIKNILGSPNSRHSLRWNRLTFGSQAQYYNVDQRVVSLQISKKF